ncbi:hypothetical protein KAR91_57370 [Candidatus Pacearchaeota archaeon]|nr:hypothetical protein [Candidatus Pacearchaeota archaeon]
MAELFTDEGIDIEVVKEHLGDDYYNDPGTNSEPTKMFENVKDRATLLKNYASAQRTISKGEADFAERTKGMVNIPGEDASEDVIKAYRKATGVPESTDGYKLDIDFKDDPMKEAITANAEKFKPVAHELGMTNSQFNKAVEFEYSLGKAMEASLEKQGQALIDSEVAGMKELHKEKYDTFIAGTDDALAKFKDGAAVKALLDTYGIGNSPEIRNLLAEIAPLVNEGKTVFGETSGTKPEGGFPTYQYDENGKVID